MKNFKRIISFVMAMIICMSFCLVGNTVFAVQNEDYYNDTKYFFGDDGSYAYAAISNRGPNEEETDLAASTYVRNDFWWEDQLYNTTEVEAYVSLDITFDAWHPSPLVDTARARSYNAGAEAGARGEDHDDFDHWVEAFTSTHLLYKYELVYDEELGYSEYVESQWGSVKTHSWRADD